MIRKFIALAGAGILAAGLALTAVAPASAAGSFYMQLKGTSFYIVDTGAGSLVEMGGAFTYYTEIAEGGGWFELEDNSGRCLNIGSNEYAYSNSCSGTTTEQWLKSGYQFENRHYALWLNGEASSGAFVFLSDDSGNANAQWATPGA